MIRLLFVVFVSLGGFAAAALWSARGGDAGAVVENVLPEGVGAAVRAEAERLGLNVAELLADSDSIAGADSRGANDSGSGGNGESGVAKPEPVTEMPRSDETPIEVRDIAPRSEFARDLGGSSDAVVDDDLAIADEDPEADIWVGSADFEALRGPEESADLIRRMLALYQRTGERE